LCIASAWERHRKGMASVLKQYNMDRICVYPKDVQAITGRSLRFSRKLIKSIKEKYSKEKHQFVTVEEFCQYSGFKKELVQSLMN